MKGFNGSAVVSESQQESSFVPQTFDLSDQEIIARSELYFGSDFTEIPVITIQSTPIQDENLRETENSTVGFHRSQNFINNFHLRAPDVMLDWKL